MRDVYRRAPPALSPACLATVSRRAPRPARPAPGPPPLRPLRLARARRPASGPAPAPAPDPECELACDACEACEASCLAGDAPPPRAPPGLAGVTVRGEEELPCELPAAGGAGAGAWSAGARAYVTLPRRRGAAAELFRNAPLPPRRTTPDGTDIYYWCDVPRRRHAGRRSVAQCSAV